MTKVEYHKAWRQRRRDQGVCLSCPRPAKVHPDGTVANYCTTCQEAKTARKTARYVKKGWHTAPVIKATGLRPGPTWCLLCEAHFDSPDVPNVRICPRCKPVQASIDIAPEWAAVSCEVGA